MSICCIHPQASLPAIDVVQNLYSTLGLTQTLERDGSLWTRSVTDSNILEQSFSEFYGETLVSSLTLSSIATSDAILNASGSSVMILVETTTISGGRTGGGGSGDTTSTFSVIYDSGGPDVDQGLWAYIDSGDSEAKLALQNGTTDQAEVAGMITNSPTAGAIATVATEGIITLSDWTLIAGTTLLTPGATYYLTTAGMMSVTPPATDNLVVLGRAVTTTSFDIEINLPLAL